MLKNVSAARLPHEASSQHHPPPGRLSMRPGLEPLQISPRPALEFKEAEAEAAAKELGLGDGEDSLRAMILARQGNRAAGAVSFLYGLAEKYSNKKLKEICYQFVFQNLKILNKNQMTELTESLPLLGEKALLELQQTKGRPQNSVDVANKFLGINLGDPCL